MGKSVVVANDAWYKKLVIDLKKLAFDGIVKTKWEIGKRIREDELKFEKPEYGSKRIENLGKDLGMSRTDLFYCIQFSKKSPDRGQLESLKNESWSYIKNNYLPETKRLPKPTPPAPKGKYNIIYADPPWDYWGGGYKNQSQYYDTMKWQEICKLPINDIADKNCILFMWATFPALEQGIEVIKSWGFRYSTAGFVWVKATKNMEGFSFGCGYWTRANCEPCLIGIKGKIECKDHGISQIIYDPPREHSRKPDEVREKIVKLVGDLPRIELFAREKTNGWDVWGNESGKFSE